MLNPVQAKIEFQHKSGIRISFKDDPKIVKTRFGPSVVLAKRNQDSRGAVIPLNELAFQSWTPKEAE